jgi:hypothetical protein
MRNGTIQAPEGQPPAVTAQRLSLLDAALHLAAVMRYSGLSLGGTAERLAAYDSQPYPLTYVVSSNHVIDFLRALAGAQQAQLDGRLPLEAEHLGPRPSYGPRLREVRS